MSAVILDFSKTLDPYFDDLFSDAEGYVAVSYGDAPNKAVFYEWPAEKGKFLADAAKHNATTNVFFCPALRQTTDTTPEGGLSAEVSKPVEPMSCLWLDVDYLSDAGEPKAVDQILLRRLVSKGAWRSRSGRSAMIDGRRVWNEHDILPLAEAVDLATHQRLNKDLKNAVGADHAQSHVKWLRVPTFTSYKPVLPHPREVMITARPTERWTVDELEALIRPQGSPRRATKRRQGTGTTGRQRRSETRVTSLLRRYASEGGNRSDQFHGVVLAGVEDGVSLDRLAELLAGHVVSERFEREGRFQEMLEKSAEQATTPPDAVPVRKLRVVRASSVKARRQKWLWTDRVPTGALCLLGGREGSGKSTVGVDLAARVTRGEVEGEYHGVPRSVIYVATEDAWEYTLVPRLIAAGADMERVLFVEADEAGETDNVNLPTDNEQMTELIKSEDVGLVVLDPILSALDPDVDERQQRKLRRALEPINTMADEAACAVLGIVHFNKRQDSGDIGVMISGLLVWSQVCRASMAMVKHPEEPDQFVLSNGKNNLAPPTTPSLQGRTVEHWVNTDEGQTRTSKVEWLGESPLSVSDILAPPKSEKPRSAIDRWLTGLLTEHEGGVPATEVYRLGDEHNPPFSERSLQRALKRIEGTSDRPDGYQGKVVWSLDVEELT
ncbi:AAA family ATPase [Pseudonocardia alaniniphila]|uniref:AAA family ATPase n=1 Tax=Pseudonocardia alaniniphila TaxID=75291 RepID=A0ABS9T9V9_9PSEU|nr:AAA family ATPase [Pseudonocardia alaniniphila]MCH6165319.1 AAA family ATPase [Pseudonocardia alaniniphila]